MKPIKVSKMHLYAYKRSKTHLTTTRKKNFQFLSGPSRFNFFFFFLFPLFYVYIGAEFDFVDFFFMFLFPDTCVHRFYFVCIFIYYTVFIDFTHLHSFISLFGTIEKCFLFIHCIYFNLPCHNIVQAFWFYRKYFLKTNFFYCDCCSLKIENSHQWKHENITKFVHKSVNIFDEREMMFATQFVLDRFDCSSVTHICWEREKNRNYSYIYYATAFLTIYAYTCTHTYAHVLT